ncbi:hypothetical protein CLF_103627 [Clonorchis sinensis]|uniref:Uncharacterized protein n=1 Tax=Clonorchis sinensis TaxID=79923 RepID=G7YA26_CLOSI|nr:hypothetical protein CLF_103627 [Clonorchis sinensis]
MSKFTERQGNVVRETEVKRLAGRLARYRALVPDFMLKKDLEEEELSKQIGFVRIKINQTDSFVHKPTQLIRKHDVGLDPIQYCSNTLHFVGTKCTPDHKKSLTLMESAYYRGIDCETALRDYECMEIRPTGVWCFLRASQLGRCSPRVSVNLTFFFKPNCTKLALYTHLQTNLVSREIHLGSRLKIAQFGLAAKSVAQFGYFWYYATCSFPKIDCCSDNQPQQSDTENAANRLRQKPSFNDCRSDDVGFTQPRLRWNYSRLKMETEYRGVLGFNRNSETVLGVDSSLPAEIMRNGFAFNNSFQANETSTAVYGNCSTNCMIDMQYPLSKTEANNCADFARHFEEVDEQAHFPLYGAHSSQMVVSYLFADSFQIPIRTHQLSNPYRTPFYKPGLLPIVLRGLETKQPIGQLSEHQLQQHGVTVNNRSVNNNIMSQFRNSNARVNHTENQPMAAKRSLSSSREIAGFNLSREQDAQQDTSQHTKELLLAYHRWSQCERTLKIFIYPADWRPQEIHEHIQSVEPSIVEPTRPRTEDVTPIGDKTFAIKLPSSANRPTTSQRTRTTYIPQQCPVNLFCPNSTSRILFPKNAVPSTQPIN